MSSLLVSFPFASAVWQDLVIILDTCGVGRLSPASPAPKMLRAAKHASWEALELTMSELFGGIYKLCWCSSVGSCISAADFQIDIGNLLLLGPVSFAQDKTCVSGLTCVLDGITMYGSIETDSIAIMETCGVQINSSWPMRTMRTNLLEGKQIVLSQHSLHSQPGPLWFAYVKVGPLSSAGGSYRLCWCGLQNCQLDDFTTDFGRFDLVGLSPLQQVTVPVSVAGLVRCLTLLDIYSHSPWSLC